MTRPITAAFLATAVFLGARVRGADTRGVLQFPSGVELVNLNVSVMNGRDRYVTDLRPDDFVVVEDGVRQKPTVFVQETLPISMAVLLDMSASMTPNLAIVKRAAARLIEGLRAEDEAEIIQFSDQSTVLQDFTTDHAKLTAAVAGARAGGGTALDNTLYVTLREMESLAKSQEIRRRAIVLLSDGLDTTSKVSDERVLEAARACDTSIYTILLGETGQERGAGSDDERARYLLGSLARESGGQAFYPKSAGDLAHIYERVAQELRSQYNIGYVSTNPSLDGAWRQVLVMTPGQGGFKVRHRLGYFAMAAPPKAKPRVSQVTTAP